MSEFMPLDSPHFSYVNVKSAEDELMDVVGNYIKSLELKIASAIMALQDGYTAEEVLVILKRKSQ
jgi:hypothetical protein